MRKLLEKTTRGTAVVFENPGIAAALYAGAVAAVVVTMRLRREG